MTNVAGKEREWTYEELCDSCREMVADMDQKRWLIGDTGLLIETRYGERTTEDFARDIGAAKSTVFQYRKMSAFYTPEIRAKIHEDMPNLMYSHLRTGLKFDTVDNALNWLEMVSDNSWSVDQAAYELSKKQGHETHTSLEGQVSRKFTQEDGFYVTIKFDNEVDVKMGQAVTIRAK